MQWDAEEPRKRERERDRLLRDYAARDLGRFSDFYRSRFAESGIEPRRIRRLGDLASIAPLERSELIEDPARFLVQPSASQLARHGNRRVVLELLLARVTRRLDAVNRKLVEPLYKPAMWLFDDGVPIAYTDTDLERVGEAGSRVLHVVGLDRGDLLVGLTDAGPQLAHWQLTLGARRAGVTALHLGPQASAATVADAHPTALAGPFAVLQRVLASARQRGTAMPDLRVILVTGSDPGASDRDALAAVAADVAVNDVSVVACWAPRGARALWPECPSGAVFHTFPDWEIVEVGRGGGLHADGEGELIWSALGWHGTALFRSLTGTRAELIDGECPGCGRHGPMVQTGSRDALVAVTTLERWDGVRAFQVDLADRDGAEELVVYLALDRGADLIDVLDEVDEHLDATQYIVLPPRQVEARVARTGSRVTDRR